MLEYGDSSKKEGQIFFFANVIIISLFNLYWHGFLKCNLVGV